MNYNICYIVIKNAKRKPYTLCKCKDTGTYIAWRGTQKATACGNKIFSLLTLLILQNAFRLKMNKNGSKRPISSLTGW